ncbi:MAG: hypothetical protein WEA76_03105 [Acidimicrobiia bacterium]
MRPAIATVIGSGWEPRLVDHARATGLARLVGRCCDLAGLADVARRADAVFIGSESHWLTHADLGHLALETRLIGVASDAPGARLLGRAGVTDVIDAATPPAGMLSIALSTPAQTPGRLIEVTGPRGAPGRSEVALALVYALGCGVRLVEVDAAAPSLGLRMGLAPSQVRAVADLGDVSLDPAPVGTAPVSVDQIVAHVERARSTNAVTVLDTGPDSTLHRVIDLDDVVFVGEATDVGVVRLARLCDVWLGPTPRLVINRHRPDQDLRRVRRATGLEPSAVIPNLPMPDSGRKPSPEMRSALRTVLAQRTAL